MSDAAPSIATDQTPDGVVAVLHGHWTAAQLTQPAALRAVSSALQAQKGAGGWDLRPIQSLDHLGALLLWDHWQRQWPARLPRGRRRLALASILCRDGRATRGGRR